MGNLQEPKNSPLPQAIDDNSLENVSGGNDQFDKDIIPTLKYPDQVCPQCGETGMSESFEYVNGVYTPMMHCINCYHAFYYDNNGTLVDFGPLLG